MLSEFLSDHSRGLPCHVPSDDVILAGDLSQKAFVGGPGVGGLVPVEFVSSVVGKLQP